LGQANGGVDLFNDVCFGHVISSFIYLAAILSVIGLLNIRKIQAAGTTISTLTIELQSIFPDPFLVSIFAATDLDWRIGIAVTTLKIVAELAILDGEI